MIQVTTLAPSESESHDPTPTCPIRSSESLVRDGSVRASRCPNRAKPEPSISSVNPTNPAPSALEAPVGRTENPGPAGPPAYPVRHGCPSASRPPSCADALDHHSPMMNCWNFVLRFWRLSRAVMPKSSLKSIDRVLSWSPLSL